MIDYIKVPQFENGHVCQMCVAYDSDVDGPACRSLPDCTGFVFVRPEDLPEYHVRFIADRMENL